MLHKVAETCVLGEGCEGSCAILLIGYTKDGAAARHGCRDREELDEEEEEWGESCDVGEGKRLFANYMTEHHAGGTVRGISTKIDVKEDRYVFYCR